MTRPNHQDRLKAERIVRRIARRHGLDAVTADEPQQLLEHRPSRPSPSWAASLLAGVLLAFPVLSMIVAGVHTIWGTWWALPATCLLWSGVFGILVSIAGPRR